VQGPQNAFYDIEYYKQHKIKKDLARYQAPIIQIQKNNYSDNIKNHFIQKYMVKIRNLGLIMIIQTKNLGALQMLMSISPTYFLDYSEDVLSAVLLMSVK